MADRKRLRFSLITLVVAVNTFGVLLYINLRPSASESVSMFVWLVGKDGILDQNDMQTFTDFALQVVPPPNPVRNLDNSQTAAQMAGAADFAQSNVDGPDSCDTCHVLDPLNGFFGSGGGQSFEGEPQNLKIPHLRNVYAKIGMFGMFIDTATLDDPIPTIGPLTGDQVRGFGFIHDGIVDTLESFVSVPLFTLNDSEEANLEQFMLAFDSDLAPMVGQQVTLDATNSAVVGPRITEMLTQADTNFDSRVLGGTVKRCDVVVKGTVGGLPRGWARPAHGGLRRRSPR